MAFEYEFAALRNARVIEHRYLLACRKQFRLLSDQELWDSSIGKGAALAYAKSTYDEGRRILMLVSGTWDEFYGFLNFQYFFSTWVSKTEQSAYHKRFARDTWGSIFRRNPNLAFREGQAYRKQPHHKAKEKNPKEDWRTQICLVRDKARCSYRRIDKAGPWNKQQNHRKNRRAVTTAIKSGRWDDFTDHVQDVQRVWWD
jgi:hypothetical protein